MPARPVGDLQRMDVELPGDLLNGLKAFERLLGDSGFELCLVSSTLGFHLSFLG